MNTKQFERPKYVPHVLDPKKVRILNILGNEPSPNDRIICDRHRLKRVLEILREEGKKIVYTSGVYDLKHDGHVKYLMAAKKLGDILIVGLDEDELVRKRKTDNQNRPYDDLSTRATLMVDSRSVDILCVRYADEGLNQLIFDILPDVAVFSKSTKDTPNFEVNIRTALSDYCGEIVFLEPQSSNSTTAKMGKLMKDGAQELSDHLKKKLKNKIPIAVLNNAINSYFKKITGGTK